MNATLDWTAHSGDAWLRRWRELDVALDGIAVPLDSEIASVSPDGPFHGFDIGCGAGTTSLKLATARQDARIIACDISPGLVELARQRLSAFPAITVELGDAPDIALSGRAIDLYFSRHGVMFFDDPPRAFRDFRAAAAPGAVMIFSCFREWAANPWAGDLAEAASGHLIPPPGEEPGGFAFADPERVRKILTSTGWGDCANTAVDFRYRAGSNESAIDFLSDVGPASRELAGLAEADRPAALDRMRALFEQYRDGDEIVFPAAAWIWTARVSD